ncbi:MAG: 2-phosphosulfolactate phosphatase [Ignavibacteria bacterium]|nr:2-phosphosulfolactate phosphatase [Ignavibacteria bacterium]
MEIIGRNSGQKGKINIDLYFSHTSIDSELELKDKNVIIIDVLRTSTTMITGLANGAKEIIPTESIAAAGLIGRNSEGQALLCGERNGKIIEGFNLGNSVKEYKEENVKNKILVFNSTNGTVAILKAKFSRNCVIASFTNISRVAQFLKELNQDFIICCAGREGRFSLEDTVCGGMLVYLVRSGNPNSYSVSDSATGAEKLYTVYRKDLKKMLHISEHGKYLVSIGFSDDLEECAKVDACNILPVMRNGIIKTTEAFASDPKLTLKKISQGKRTGSE